MQFSHSLAQNRSGDIIANPDSMDDLEPGCASFQSYCKNIVGHDTSSRFAMLLTLPCRFKEQRPDSEQADSILSSIPEELLEELLSTDDEQLSRFQDLAIDILETLLPSCSSSILEDFAPLIPYLVHRLEAAKKDINALDSISKCIISLCFDGDLACTEYVHETADILTSFCVENSKDFPFIAVLKRLTECMLILQHHDENYELVHEHHSWPKNTRAILNSFLKTRTEMLTDEMRTTVFRLTKEVIETLGTDWFAPDVKLLLLLVHLVVVQVRMCLDKPESINLESLAVCFHILESAIRCAEESSFLEDSVVTQMATSIREAALYSIQYLIEAKEQNEHLPEEVIHFYHPLCCRLIYSELQTAVDNRRDRARRFCAGTTIVSMQSPCVSAQERRAAVPTLVTGCLEFAVRCYCSLKFLWLITFQVELMVYRFTSCFLAIGGAQMLPEALLQKFSPIMLQIFERSVAARDFKTAHLLLPNLDALPHLNDNIIISIVDLVILQYPGGEWKQAIDDAICTLESLRSRVDYYSNKTVEEARSKLKKIIPNCKLLETLSCM
ncbi:hypothetical protein Y032_0006g2943 [Ancylostoma ceylanicum]|uniref:Neurochondrin n=1 Tax=Ancylostoma ceylanicum TaxID=53326 RepID=A0A016VPW1_9BILA|nr:hypothetical protein Y032_0006g2943 [Ancylostoma ceylanicum]